MSKELTWLDIVREVFPGVSDDQADALLWNRTGFPGFWETDDPVKECRDQLIQFRDSGGKNISPIKEQIQTLSEPGLLPKKEKL